MDTTPDTVTAPQPAHAELSPARILQIGSGFWPSKVLLAAVRFRLFTLLAPAPMSGPEIKQRLDLHCTDRHVYDWLDALTSLGFLQRDGLLERARYANAPDADRFLDTNKPTYTGGVLEMMNNRLYGFWGSLEEALQTGAPQNEGKGREHGNMEFFADMYADERKLREFIGAMAGIQAGNFIALARAFDFDRYPTLLDVGGADASLSIRVCQQHERIRCITFDLPPVEPLARENIERFQLSDRIQTTSGDLLTDPFPPASLIAMGNILHGFDEGRKQSLIRKVSASLPDHGALIVIENIIDNERRHNTFGLLMSLNMLIENGEAFDFTAADFERWAKPAGFRRIEVLPLTGPASAIVAYK